LPQDLPFGIINSLFLLRAVDDLRQGCTGPRCSTGYNRTTFYVLLLVLLTSVAGLVYKLMRSLTLTELWQERNQLRSIKAELAERARRLQMSVPGPEGGESDSDSDIDRTAKVGGASQAPSRNTLDCVASGFSPLRDNIVAAAFSQEALEGDRARPTREMVVLIAFETDPLPECGR
jgi:hypothetical protein